GPREGRLKAGGGAVQHVNSPHVMGAAEWILEGNPHGQIGDAVPVEVRGREGCRETRPVLGIGQEQVFRADGLKSCGRPKQDVRGARIRRMPVSVLERYTYGEIGESVAVEGP